MFQMFLNDFYVQQVEEVVVEVEVQCGRVFWFVEQRGIVKVQFVQCVVESFIIIGVYWEQVGIYLWFYFFKVRQCFVCWVVGGGQGIVYWCVEDVFDCVDQLVYFVVFQFGMVNLFWGEDVQMISVIDLVGVYDFDFVVFVYGVVFNLYQ